MLKDIFIQLVGRYSTNGALAQTIWMEIEEAYSGKKRHYHNLQHLQNMYDELLPCRDVIADWDTLLFTVFYHDIVYKATSKENEEKSAAVAVLRLTQISYPQEKIAACHAQIIATKLHGLSPDNDTNLLTDADLSILGKDWDVYLTYSQAVRKEYAVYPDFLYKPGRAKALGHFIDMEAIFKTTYFQDKYGQNASTNLKKELSLLV